MGNSLDSYLDKLTAIQNVVNQLRAENEAMIQAIRRDWQSSSHSLCWFKPELWKHDPLYREKAIELDIPPKDEFLKCCGLYRDSLDSLTIQQIMDSAIPKLRSAPVEKLDSPATEIETPREED